MRVEGVLPVEVSHVGAETPLGWERLVVVTAEVPLADHVRVVSGLVHVLGQHLSGGMKNEKTNKNDKEQKKKKKRKLSKIEYLVRNNETFSHNNLLTKFLIREGILAK